MKIRKGYVSNSSSSSYVCDVCGHAESGFDASLCDLGMVRCTRGHIFCEGHIVGDRYSVDNYRNEINERLLEPDRALAEFLEEQWPTWAQDMASVSGDSSIDDVLPKEIEDDFYDVITDDWGTSEVVTRSCCPICLMEHITDYDLLDYTIAISGKSQTELVNEIKAKFAHYSELKQYNRENRRK